MAVNSFRPYFAFLLSQSRENQHFKNKIGFVVSLVELISIFIHQEKGGIFSGLIKKMPKASGGEVAAEVGHMLLS